MDNLNDIKNDKNIANDRLRYEKNTIPSLFCYLAIVFDVIYFIAIYRVNDAYFYTWMMFVSILCNLFFLLGSFLSSEEIKNYNKKFAYLMIGLGVLQIVRIFAYCLPAHLKASVTYDGEVVLRTSVFVRCLIYLIGSSASMIAGAVIGILRCNRLEKRLKELKKGE